MEYILKQFCHFFVYENLVLSHYGKKSRAES